ncbi:zinc ribbon domain-containing protein [Lutispora sp.]|uniref:zinc ribbon domain-containing protein n=1 Tax=Lutispora sp. TaxID=2828727 RepID=UPI002B2106EC|nr:C4-type zinc ribbon domain-containing protein [Lutispora sp.]MEA4960314.1 C4-type zinc ribbon domain-containing protein [Lutispora sp.]
MGLEFLYELQHQENNHKKLLSRISEISDDGQINRLKKEYAKLKEEYIKLCEKKNEIEKQIAQKKSHYKSLELSKTNYEKLIYTPEINSVKKLETLEKQIDDVEKNLELETLNLENLEKNLKEAELDILSIKKKIVFIKKKYETMRTNKEEELDFLMSEKNNIEGLIEDIKLNINQDIYKEYIKMKEKLINPISEIDNRKCSGCGVEVPAMDYESVKTGNALKCQNCGRILIYKKNK